MKKYLLSLCLLAFTFPVSAAMSGMKCEWTDEQKIVRSSEYIKDIKVLDGTDFEKQYPCGGSLMQLAVLRGIPHVVEWTLKYGNADPNMMVSLDGYEIEGAPNKIPLILFAAYYSPNADTVDVLVKYGAKNRAVDSKGNDIFWYLDQNPVLRESFITKHGHDYWEIL